MDGLTFYQVHTRNLEDMAEGAKASERLRERLRLPPNPANAKVIALVNDWRNNEEAKETQQKWDRMIARRTGYVGEQS